MLEGEALGAFLKGGAARPGFSTIVGSGPNGVIPHYFENSRRIEPGDGPGGLSLTHTLRDGSVETMRTIVETCPAPVLMAGGARQERVADAVRERGSPKVQAALRREFG